MTTVAVHGKSVQADILAGNLPRGRAWVAKHDDTTNLRKLLLGLGLSIINSEETLALVGRETQLATTEALISEWEDEYGASSGCFSRLGNQTIEERIANVKLMIAANGASTAEQFETIASIIGLTVSVQSGIDLISFPLTFPVFIISENREARYTIIVDMDAVPSSGSFPYTFPITFGSAQAFLLKCLFSKLKPANCQIIYVNEG